MILAIDPGLQKCGIALLDNKQVKLKEIVHRNQIISRIIELGVNEVVVGGGTGSATIIEELKKNSIKVIEVDEKNTTLYARKLYWIDNPPKGLLRFIPKGLLFPPRPIDDYAAVVIGQQYLEK